MIRFMIKRIDKYLSLIVNVKALKEVLSGLFVYDDFLNRLF